MFHKTSKKTPGSSPGTLVYTGDKIHHEVAYELIELKDDKCFHEREIKFKDLIKNIESKALSWVNVTGLHEIDRIREIGAKLGIDQLTLEDILNVNQRPKLEKYDNYLYVVLQMYFTLKDGTLHSEQVSIVVKENVVVTFQEKEGDIFNSLRDRMKVHSKVIEKRGADYILYALMDVIVDYYLDILSKQGEAIDELDEKFGINSVDDNLSSEIYSFRNKILKLRRKMIPVREIVNMIQKSDSNLLKDETSKFFRDLYDHCVSVNEMLDSQRDTLSDLLSQFQTVMNNKMNETMKVLTIIATIFIPLSFIVGLYGMNFEYMPELSYRYGYFVVLGVIFVVSAFMVYYFRKKRWI